MNLCNCLSFRQQHAGGSGVLHNFCGMIENFDTNILCLLSHSQESRGKRPLKIWDSLRNIRKGLVVGSFEELIVRGKKSLKIY